MTLIESVAGVDELGVVIEMARERGGVDGVGRMNVCGVALLARGTAMERCLRMGVFVSFATFADTDTVLFLLSLLGSTGVVVPEEEGEEDNPSVVDFGFRRESKRRPKNILRCRRRLVGLNEGTTD